MTHVDVSAEQHQSPAYVPPATRVSIEFDAGSYTTRIELETADREHPHVLADFVHRVLADSPADGPVR